MLMFSDPTKPGNGRFIIAEYHGPKLYDRYEVSFSQYYTENVPSLHSLVNMNGFYRFGYATKGGSIREINIQYDGHYFGETAPGSGQYVYNTVPTMAYSTITEVLSYAMFASLTSTNGSVLERTRVLLYNKYYYKITAIEYAKIYLYRRGTSPAPDLGDIVVEGSKIAKQVIKIYNTSRTNEDIKSGSFYTNSENSLGSGELYADDTGKVYSTLQYKTSYFERDSELVITAVADSGYRLENWYIATYDDVYGWIVSDEPASKTLQTKYSSEIIKTEFPSSSSVTTYTYDTDGFYPNGDRYKRSYQISSSTSIEVLFSDDLSPVPDSIRTSYAGIFINVGNSRENPKFVQVYSAGANVEDLYYDAELTMPVKITDFSVHFATIADYWANNYIGYMNYYDAVHASYSYEGLTIKTPTWNPDGLEYTTDDIDFTFNGFDIYAVFEYNNRTLSYDLRYYKSFDKGNFSIEGNTIRVYKMHSNLRFVAKFVDTYQAYIFNEMEQDSGITIEALYYFNEDETKETIRTNSSNVDKTKDDTFIGQSGNFLGSGYEFFITDDETGLTDEEGNKLKRTLFDRVPVPPDAGPDYEPQSYFTKYYDKKSQENFAALSAYRPMNAEGLSGINNNQINANGGSFEKAAYAMYKDKPRGTTLSLKNYYFDSNTTLYLIVRLKVGYELSVHSLGLNSKYNLNFLVQPNVDAIKEDNDQYVTYMFYVLKVTLDRSMEQTDGLTTTIGNENPEYVIHPQKAKNITSDILSGYNIDYYDSIYDYYVSFDSSKFNEDVNISKNNYITLKYGTNETKVKIAFDKSNKETNARSFAYSRYMSEYVYYWLVSLGAFENIEVSKDVNGKITGLTRGVASSEDIINVLEYGGKTFDFKNYIDETDPLTNYEAIRKYINFLFQNINGAQSPTSSRDANYYTSISVINNVLYRLTGKSNILNSYQLPAFYYYMTISGDIFITENFINEIFNHIVPAISSSEKLGDVLTDYTKAVILTLVGKSYLRLADFFGELNQIIYAATSVEGAVELAYVLKSESYYNMQSMGDDNAVKYNVYSALSNRETNYMNNINKLFYVDVKNYKNYYISTKGSEDAGDIKVSASGYSSMFGATPATEPETPVYLKVPKKIYTYGPFPSSRVNYINLASITIYTISVSTSIVDSIDMSSDAIEDETLLFNTNNFTENPYFILDDTIYVGGGVSSSIGDLTFVGNALKTEDLNIKYVDGYSKFQNFTTSYSHNVGGLIDYELYDKAKEEGKYNYSSYGDMSFAEYSIILWGGLKLRYQIDNINDITEYTNAYTNIMSTTSNGTRLNDMESERHSSLLASENYNYIPFEDGKYFAMKYSQVATDITYYIYSNDFKTVYEAVVDQSEA
ncbi:MAG: hypothetical protein J6J33_00990, partial [Clostridia bacterium]|nr:hypothetical protein [Clostridia bacterium]